MKTLPNGVEIFNATPHIIRFWQEGWKSPVEVETDTVINAIVEENVLDDQYIPGVTLVTTKFVTDAETNVLLMHITEHVPNAIIVGSIIAAQAYPGLVVAMIPAPGYERVPPAQKRMRPDKFTVF